MSAAIIQANYDSLEQIATRFETSADTMDKLLQHVTRSMDNLRGEWIGEGSERFFAEMESEVLPATVRLRDALSESSEVTRTIATLIRDAEEEAAALFAGSAVMAMMAAGVGGFAFAGDNGRGGPNVPGPPAPPSSGAADGSGVHGAMGDPTDADWETHSKMRWAARAADLRGWDVMAEHMHHFLDNSGEPLDVSVDDMLSDMPEFQARVDQQSQVVMNQMINQEIANSYDGTPMTFEVTTPWLSDYYPDKSDYPDWYYGVGGFSYAQSATVTVTPNPAGGDPIVTVTSQTHMFDRYNWDAGKSVTLPSTGIDWIDDHTMAGDYIPDTQMGRLHGTGIAQEYELHGSSSKRVTTYHYDPNTGLQPPPSTDNGGR